MDIQLRNKAGDRWIFVNEHVVGRRGTKAANLLFVAETVRWNKDAEENVTEGKEMIAAGDFGAWWQRHRNEGWVICDG